MSILGLMMEEGTYPARDSQDRMWQILRLSMIIENFRVFFPQGLGPSSAKNVDFDHDL